MKILFKDIIKRYSDNSRRKHCDNNLEPHIHYVFLDYSAALCYVVIAPAFIEGKGPQLFPKDYHYSEYCSKLNYHIEHFFKLFAHAELNKLVG